MTQSTSKRSNLLNLFLFSILTVCLGATSFADEMQIPETPPPGKIIFTNNSEPIQFPFEIFNGDIRFQCEVNGNPVYMLLDDGFMWDQLLFWGGPKNDSLGFVYDGEIGIGESATDENQIPSKTASNVTISFPGVDFTGQTAIIMPNIHGADKMWHGSEGQVSAMFFKHFIVDINFDNMIITLHKKDGFKYKGNGMAIPWKPVGFGPWSIPATLSLADGRNIDMTLLMDLGYNDQLQLATNGEHKIPIPENSTPASLGINIQKIETRGFIGRLPYIKLGEYQINDLLVSYVSEEHSDRTISEAMIGLGLLSRFNLTFDYYNQRLFIELTKNYNRPFKE